MYKQLLRALVVISMVIPLGVVVHAAPDNGIGHVAVSHSMLDRSGSVGQHTSLALTSSGVPVISYYDSGNTHLKLAVCDDAACTSPTLSTLDSDVNVGLYTSIALTSSDIPIISYYDGINQALKLAVCNDAACTSPTLSTIDSGGVGQYTSIALTAANVPVISYWDFINRDLKLAVCNDAACTSPTLSTLDSGGVGEYTSLALTTADVPVISYFDSANLALKLAVCDDAACTSPTLSTIDSGGVGFDTSLALTSSDVPVISYFDVMNGYLKLAVCNDAACTSPTLSTIDSGLDTSLALTSSDVPVISYFDNSNLALKLVVCDDAACTSPAISTIDSTGGDVGYFSSIALTSSDEPVISYNDQANGALKLYNQYGSILFIDSAPISFTKSTPTNNATNRSTNITLTWAASTNATSYAYCIALTQAACTTWISTGTSTTATKRGLVHNTTYYWQVRAINDSGTTLANTGQYWRFKVVLPPAAFNKTSPANNAKNQPTKVTLTWAASTRATSYEYCIALTKAACTKWKSVGSRRAVAVSGLAKGKTYFWQVRAKNAGGTVISSGGYRKFTTKR